MSSPPHAPSPAEEPVLRARGLRCARGRGKERVEVLTGVDLEIPAGGILAVLGANGAGKTTLILALATLLPITDGEAVIAGHDVSADPAGARAAISLTGQYAAVDERLSGRENLEYFGRLSGLDRRRARSRAGELLERFSLADSGDRLVSDYSGGMRRRLDIAVSLMVPPRLLFLDEPTTGLDPASRNEVWRMVRDLSDSGTSILLTTQYLEEADHLADRVAVLAGGRVVDEGTSAELKSRYGTPVCDITLASPEAASALADAAADAGMTVRREGQVLHADAPAGHRDLIRLLDLWRGDPDEITDAAMTPPSLEDVYNAVADSGDIAGGARRAPGGVPDDDPAGGGGR